MVRERVDVIEMSWSRETFAGLVLSRSAGPATTAFTALY